MSRVRVKQIKGTETSAIEGISLYLPSYQRVGKEREGERERKTPTLQMSIKRLWLTFRPRPCPFPKQIFLSILRSAALYFFNNSLIVNGGPSSLAQC